MKWTPSDRSADWQQNAACRGTDPEAFFADDQRDLVVPKSICAGCPVRAECLAWADANPAATTHGVWGGLDRRQRKARRDRARRTETA